MNILRLLADERRSKEVGLAFRKHLKIACFPKIGRIMKQKRECYEANSLERHEIR